VGAFLLRESDKKVKTALKINGGSFVVAVDAVDVFAVGRQKETLI
jgi:hypothetical protein